MFEVDVSVEMADLVPVEVSVELNEVVTADKTVELAAVAATGGQRCGSCGCGCNRDCLAWLGGRLSSGVGGQNCGACGCGSSRNY